MFATFRRFRRHVAVLTALAMLASVLVAVPAVAADDPNADYTATFDACENAPSAGFSDVPAAHANAGDIDCIAYYAITQGTSATTYSPMQSVTREQMALFLTRLAGVVGIEMAEDPDDPGFSDTGDLSEESQAAIAQLADLDITQGTSASTYSPGDTVTRAHMALFIQRLMNKMAQLADGDPSLGSTTVFGYLPSDVAKNKRVKVKEGGVLQPVAPKIASSFTDLNRVSKDEHDAITQLWEMGVAAGISATSYGPDAVITRAAMAGFMAGVLDHSNARPAGLSIQVTPETGWGTVGTTILVSLRDDSFAPVEDMSIDVFNSAAANNGLANDGTCNQGDAPDEVGGGDLVDGNCTWNTNDDATDVSGNIFLDGEVAPGKTRVWSAWVGEDDGDTFDSDKFDASTDDATAMPEQAGLKVTSTINKHAACYTDDAYDTCDDDASADTARTVNLASVGSVTYTVQLVDDDGSNVERADIEIDVGYNIIGSYKNTLEADLVTGDSGQVDFTVDGPVNTRSTKDDRNDEITFTGYHPGQARDVIEEETRNIRWTEGSTVLTTSILEVDDYVLERRGEAKVNAVVRLYDQYGNSHRSHSTQKVVINIGITDHDVGGVDADAAQGLEDVLDNADLLEIFGTGDNAVDQEDNSLRQVVSRGFARWSRTAPGAANGSITVTYNVRHLTRNSDGVAVIGVDVDGAVVADDNDDLDDNDITYNDGRVAVGRTAVIGTVDGVDNVRTESYLDTTSTPNGQVPVYKFDDDFYPKVNVLHVTGIDTLEIDDETGTDGRRDVVAEDEDVEGPVGEFSRGEVLITRAIKAIAEKGTANSNDDDYVHQANGAAIRNILSNAFDLHTDEEGKTVPVVDKADSQDVDVEVTVTHIFADDDVFLTDAIGATGSDDDADDDDGPINSRPELVYSYDSDDLYIDSSSDGDGAEISMEKFEARLGGNFDTIDEHATVEVLVYDADGQSIFRVKSKASGS